MPPATVAQTARPCALATQPARRAAVFCLFVCSLRCAGNPLATVYRASDGRQFWLLGQEAQRHWPATAKALGRPEWISDGECVLQRSALRCNAAHRVATQCNRPERIVDGRVLCALQFVADAVARAQPSVRVAALTHLLGTAWPARFKDARSRRKLEKELCAKMDEIFATKTLKEHPHERTRADTHAHAHARAHALTQTRTHALARARAHAIGSAGVGVRSERA